MDFFLNQCFLIIPIIEGGWTWVRCNHGQNWKKSPLFLLSSVYFFTFKRL